MSISLAPLLPARRGWIHACRGKFELEQTFYPAPVFYAKRGKRLSQAFRVWPDFVAVVCSSAFRRRQFCRSRRRPPKGGTTNKRPFAKKGGHTRPIFFFRHRLTLRSGLVKVPLLHFAGSDFGGAAALV